MVFIDKEQLRKTAVSNLGLEGLSEEYQNEILAELETMVGKKLQVEVFNTLS